MWAPKCTLIKQVKGGRNPSMSHTAEVEQIKTNASNIWSYSNKRQRFFKHCSERALKCRELNVREMSTVE